MSGWTAVVTIAGLIAIAMVGLNASLWMRHKAMAAARGGWGDADFVAALAARGCSPRVIDAICTELAPYYSAGLSPRPDDELDDLLRIDADELTRLVERLSARLGVPAAPAIPAPVTVADLAVSAGRHDGRSLAG